VSDLKHQDVDPLDGAIKSLKSIQIEMDRPTRSRLVRLCAERTASSSPGSILDRLLALLAFQVPQRAMAAALGLAVLFGVALVVVSVRSDSVSPRMAAQEKIHLVSLRPDASGRITLEWRDGSQRVYRVLKSDNPRDFSRAEQYSVRGNRWTDANSGADQVSFYRVE